MDIGFRFSPDGCSVSLEAATLDEVISLTSVSEFARDGYRPQLEFGPFVMSGSRPTVRSLRITWRKPGSSDTGTEVLSG